MGMTARFIQFTDLHLCASPEARLKNVETDASFAAVVDEALSAAHPDGLLLTGDLAQDGSEEAYARLVGRLRPFGLRAWCIPGNHDSPDVLSAALPAPLFGLDRTADFGPWRLLFLSTHDGDRGGGRLGDTELAAVSEVLAAPGPEHILIVMHHHPVRIDSWLDESAALDDADAFWEAAGSSSRLRGVIFGHVHQEVDIRRGAIRVLGTPSTCFQFVPQTMVPGLDTRPPGWRWIELLDDGRIETEVCWLGDPAGQGPA